MFFEVRINIQDKSIQVEYNIKYWGNSAEFSATVSTENEFSPLGRPASCQFLREPIQFHGLGSGIHSLKAVGFLLTLLPNPHFMSTISRNTFLSFKLEIHPQIT